MSLQQKNKLRSSKNVRFFLLCILVDRQMGWVEPPNPLPCVRPCCAVIITEDYFNYALPSVLVAVLMTIGYVLTTVISLVNYC